MPPQPVRRHARRDQKAFKRYHLFGFTGTPIFAENAGTSGNPRLRTTEQAFGDRLHTYTIVDAINDRNVLPFRLDYVNTIKLPAHLTDKQVSAIDTERALLAPERIGQVVAYILDHFDQKTKRSFAYTPGGQAARRLQLDVRHRLDRRREALLRRVREAAGRAAGGAAAQGRAHLQLRRERGRRRDFLAEEEFETDDLDASSRDFLEGAISDYNAMFGTSFDTSSDQVPELLQGPLAATEEPRARPRDRRQHVPDRLRRDHAEHALGRQEPPRARPDPGVLADEPDPQLGQDLRQHRHLPRPGAADQRRARALRQQGRPRHRPAQALRRLLRRVRRARRRAAGALPARRGPWRGESANKMFIAALRLDPATTQHPDVVRRVRRQRDPQRARLPGLPVALPRPSTPSSAAPRTPRRSRSSTTSSSRSSS